MLEADAFQGEHLHVWILTGIKHGWMSSGIFRLLALQHYPNP